MNKCPCGSQKIFDACCNAYIGNEQSAPTPEALMRSRYTAYSLANIPYIKKTMCGKAAKNYDEKDALQWALKAKWSGLTVLSSEMVSPEKGFVKFVARFKFDGLNQKIHEKSEFHKIHGVWYYVDGEQFSS